MRTRTIAVFVIAALPWMSRAAEPVAIAKFVAPYLDEQADAVIHLDVNAIDADSAIDRVAKNAGVDVQFLAEPRKALREGLAAFRKAGVNDLYAVFSVSDFPGFFVIVPRAGANDAELKTALGAIGTQEVEPLNGAMFAGGKATLERLRGLKPTAMPELEKALTAVAGSPVQVAIMPNADQRRIVAEIMPTLPKEIGGGPSTILTKGIHWAAVGIDMKPKLAVKIVVKSEDAAAAAALNQTIDKGLETVSRDQAARRMFPKLDDMVKAVRPKVEGDRLTIAVDETNPGLAGELATMAGKARQSAVRTESANHLKQIALACWNFSDANRGTFPDVIKSKDGKPLLSWRVAILPYLEQDDLYKQFKLDEPWDSEHNKKLIAKMPALYRCSAQKVGDGKTTYLAPTGMADKAHIGMLGIQIPKDVPDGTSNTFMIVESNDDAAVVWTKPDDLTVDPKDPLKGLVGHYEQGFLAAFADGSVRFIRRTIKPMNLIAVFTRDGGEVVDSSDF